MKGEKSFSFLSGSWNSNVPSEKYHPFKGMHPVCEQAYPCAQGTPQLWQQRRFVFLPFLLENLRFDVALGLTDLDINRKLWPGPLDARRYRFPHTRHDSSKYFSRIQLPETRNWPVMNTCSYIAIKNEYSSHIFYWETKFQLTTIITRIYISNNTSLHHRTILHHWQTRHIYWDSLKLNQDFGSH